jgi:hypothetical protein
MRNKTFSLSAAQARTLEERQALYGVSQSFQVRLALDLWHEHTKNGLTFGKQQQEDDENARS